MVARPSACGIADASAYSDAPPSDYAKGSDGHGAGGYLRDSSEGTVVRPGRRHRAEDGNLFNNMISVLYQQPAPTPTVRAR